VVRPVQGQAATGKRCRSEGEKASEPWMARQRETVERIEQAGKIESKLVSSEITEHNAK
jgi:hypothetical protein